MYIHTYICIDTYIYMSIFIYIHICTYIGTSVVTVIVTAIAMCYCYHTKPKTHSCLLRQDSRVYKATLLSDTNLSARLRPSKLSMMSDGLLEVFRFEVTLETQYQQLQ